MPRSDAPDHRYDAVIVGASLGGLSAGAILANKGYSVAVVDAMPQPGGRMGATEQDGYWISWGQRDGLGSTDLAYIPHYLYEAAELAGVTLNFKPFCDKYFRLHWLPERTTTELPAELVVPNNNDPMELLREMVRCFSTVTEAGEVEQLAAGLGKVLGELSDTPTEEAWQLVPVRLDDWLLRNVDDLQIRQIILQQAECNPFSPAEESSLGRYIMHLNHVNGIAVVPDDPEVGGMQGTIQPWYRRLKELGADFYQGWKPVEITHEHGEVSGVVAINDGSLVKTFGAPIVISDWPGWMLTELVEERDLPTQFVEAAQATRNYASETASWWAGLTRLPTVRATGEVEDLSSPWERILWGNGAIRRFYGGFYFPSAFSQKSAPPGKHQLVVETVGSSNQPGREWRRWADARKVVDSMVDYLFDYYSDLEDCVEWSSYQRTDPPSILTWYIKPIYRHPVKIDTIDGLYMASASAEGNGSWIDIEAGSALTAVRLAEFERGQLCQRAGQSPRG
ncbi:MAG: NAD(P)-binding protein [Novosphingobium sp.]|nr:NAD(P)-binding protein [Novosphingobium sp.]